MTSGYQRALRELDECAESPNRLEQLALDLVSKAGVVARRVNDISSDDRVLASEAKSRLLDDLGDVVRVATVLIDACDGDEDAVRRASVARVARQMIESHHLGPEETSAILRLVDET